MVVCITERGDSMTSTKKRNKIVQVLMNRDDMTEVEATEFLQECKEMIADGADLEEVLYGELGLELDYAVYLLI